MGTLGMSDGVRRADGPLDVVMVTNAVAPDKLGGLERYVRELAASLVVRGHRVTVLSKQVTPDGALEATGDDGVRIIRHPVPDKRRPTFALEYPYAVGRAVRRELVRNPRAVVHAHYAITALPVAFSSRPYVLTFHNPVHKEMLWQREASYWLPRPAQGMAVAALRAAERSVLRRAAEVFTLSDYTRREALAIAPGSEHKYTVLPGGIDTGRFAPGPANRDTWSRAADPLLFTARRLNARTGVEQLVEAMPMVLREHPRARLAIAGEGATRGSIEGLIDRLGLASSVRLLGRLWDDDLLDWYRAADLTVMPAQDLEGFGLPTGESLASGTPVLVTPVGAQPELVAALHPWLVADGKDGPSLAQALNRLLGQPGLLAELGSRSRAHVEPAWAWDTIVDRYMESYAAMSRRQERSELDRAGTS
jgi:glycosyltransferase involved in cell wall biosynthesis